MYSFLSGSTSILVKMVEFQVLMSACVFYIPWSLLDIIEINSYYDKSLLCVIVFDQGLKKEIVWFL